VNEYDFEDLESGLLEEYPEFKRTAMIFSMQASSEKILKLKVGALRKRVMNMALLSGLVGGIPLPGVSAVADIAIILYER
jgi:hypothetical protein